MKARTPLDALIDAAPMHCTLCQAPAGTCQCWEDCSFGLSTRRGHPCTNPATTDCSTKLKYGTPAQQAAWFDLLGRQAANEVLWYIDSMYPTMWENVSKTGARVSLRQVIRRAIQHAITIDRNANEPED